MRGVCVRARCTGVLSFRSRPSGFTSITKAELRSTETAINRYCRALQHHGACIRGFRASCFALDAVLPPPQCQPPTQDPFVPHMHLSVTAYQAGNNQLVLDSIAQFLDYVVVPGGDAGATAQGAPSRPYVVYRVARSRPRYWTARPIWARRESWSNRRAQSSRRGLARHRLY